MERSVWTDERLNDRFDEIGRRFDRVDRDLAELRSEMREGFAASRADLEALRETMIRIGGGMLIGFISVLTAILARGA
jgi:hypothetical protein